MTLTLTQQMKLVVMKTSTFKNRMNSSCRKVKQLTVGRSEHKFVNLEVLLGYVRALSNMGMSTSWLTMWSIWRLVNVRLPVVLALTRGSWKYYGQSVKEPVLTDRDRTGHSV